MVSSVLTVATARLRAASIRRRTSPTSLVGATVTAGGLSRACPPWERRGEVGLDTVVSWVALLAPSRTSVSARMAVRAAGHDDQPRKQEPILSGIGSCSIHREELLHIRLRELLGAARVLAEDAGHELPLLRLEQQDLLLDRPGRDEP